jgi:hypothetical protein
MRTEEFFADKRAALRSGGAEEVAAEVVVRDTEVDVHFHVKAGPVPPTARAALVDELFALPALRSRTVLHASVPLGDVELIDELRRRCELIDVRAAGATCLIDARTAG